MAASLTPSMTRATGSGTVSAGAVAVAFFNASGSVNATVAGATLKPGERVTFSIPGNATHPTRLAAMVYDAGSDGDLIVTEVR